MPGKISDELLNRFTLNITAPAIVEIEPESVSEFFDITNRFGFDIIRDIPMPQFNLRFVNMGLSKRRALDLSDLDFVKGISYDRPMHQMVDWGFPIINRFLQQRRPPVKFSMENGWIPSGTIRKALGLDKAKEMGIMGKGVRVAVLDTGYSPNNRQFAAGAVQTKSVLPGPENAGFVDPSGHGLWCISDIGGQRLDMGNDIIIEGMAPGATMLSVRCLFTMFGVSSSGKVLQAFQEAVDWKPHAISASLGSETSTPPGDPQEKVIDAATNAGILVNIAAGNSGENGPRTVGSPGDVESAITVGAVSYIDGGKRSFFSSRGPTPDNRIKPDIACYGGGRAFRDSEPEENIISSSSGLIDTMDFKNTLAAIAGTSMSTPGETGLEANWVELYFQKTEQLLTTPVVKQIYKDMGGFKNNDFGWGVATYDWLVDWLKR